MKYFTIILALVLAGFLNAQVDYQAYDIHTIELGGTLLPKEIKEDWGTYIYNLEAPFPGTNSFRNFLEIQKAKIPAPVTVKSTSKAATADSPVNFSGYQANFFGGIPNDNDLAISNAGMIISVCNSTFYVYHESSDSLWGQLSLNVFADSLDLLANPYDPRVEYDPISDRFIMVFLNGNSSNYSKIAIGFSQTNNPLDGWNMYAIEGNPLDDNAWSDFPAMALTENELFLTLNHVDSDQPSWQLGFMRSVIWQIPKAEGYSGDPIETRLYTDVKYGGRHIRNLLPVKGGSGLQGPEMYFMSNRNFDLTNDTFFIAKLDNELSNFPNINLTTDYIISDVNYGVPPNALQPNNTRLQTNDSRPLGGYIENDNIHFVGNTVNDQTNLCAIYHSIYNVSDGNKTCETTILGGDNLEYGYPNISYTGYGFADNQAMIGFNHSSIDSFPGMSALMYDDIDGYSERVHLVSGEVSVDLIQSSNVERWGDYTGNQRKYNEPSTVWVSGLVSKFLSLGQQEAHVSWVAGLKSTDTTYVAINEASESSFHAYPNPVNANLFVEFENSKKQELVFEIYDILGRKVKLLMRDFVKGGTNAVHFSTAPLNSGNYVLVISKMNGEVVHSENIVKPK